MTSYLADATIFRNVFGTQEMRSIFGDRQLVQYWLDVESALARAQAHLSIVPIAAADEIGRRARATEIDLERLRKETELVGYPILPLVHQLAELCSGDAGGFVHWGATTQDIMDTACVLQLRDALGLIERDLALVVEHLADQAYRHRDTAMAGRTHGQHALPITLGFKIAVWVDELRRHQERFKQLSPRLLRCQLGGGAGTLASLGDTGIAVHQALAAELGLLPASITWHTARDSFGEFVACCGLLAATLGKIANEVATLQQTEFGEVAEPFVPGKGSSSTMPQKRNPILCEAVIGIARLVMQETPSMLAAMMPEHERAMGEWHIEWDVLPRTCLLTSAALSHSLVIVAGLVVNRDAMRHNLTLTEGAIVAEAVMMFLARHIGRQQAHDRVYAACLRAVQDNVALRTALLDDAEIASTIPQAEFDRLLDPANYTGSAARYVDSVVGLRKPPIVDSLRT